MPTQGEISGHEPLSLPAGQVASGTVVLPCSKSIAQRALILSSLAAGESLLTGITASDDVSRLSTALSQLGVVISGAPLDAIRVRGRGGQWPAGAREVDAGENGTALRALIAVAALRPDRTTIRGARHRPVAPLIDALRTLGVDIEATGAAMTAPVRVAGNRAPRGGTIAIAGAESSQFATALLLIAPFLAQDLDLVLAPDAVSMPYVALTADLLRRFGATIEVESAHRLRVAATGALRPVKMHVEGDASAAAFYLAAAAATGGCVRTVGVGRDSLQGDVRFLSILGEMGCTVHAGADYLESKGSVRKAVQLSLRDWPDLVPPLAALAPFAAGRTRIAGIGHLRNKESDRIAVLARGLRLAGVAATEDADGLAIEGAQSASLRPALLDAAGDHRMAMAFAILALGIPGLRIKGAGAVAKSDPAFFTRLHSLLGENLGESAVS